MVICWVNPSQFASSRPLSLKHSCFEMNCRRYQLYLFKWTNLITTEEQLIFKLPLIAQWVSQWEDRYMQASNGIDVLINLQIDSIESFLSLHLLPEGMFVSIKGIF